MIEISNLVKKYGDHMAVDHLSLTVEPGKIYGLLGPNGAGKSTTMNIVTGYIGADGGTVKINGYDIFAQPEEAKKCIGYLPEIPPLYVDMTVYEYLKFVAGLIEVDMKKRRQQKEKRNYSRCHGHDRHHGGEKPSHKEPFQGLQTKSGFRPGTAWLSGNHHTG